MVVNQCYNNTLIGWDNYIRIIRAWEALCSNRRKVTGSIKKRYEIDVHKYVCMTLNYSSSQKHLSLVNPGSECGHLCVDPGVARSPTAQAPGHEATQGRRLGPSHLEVTDQWASGVALAGV